MGERAGLVPSTLTYNLALRACFTAGTKLSAEVLDRAFVLLEEMRAEGQAPDVVTYTSLFNLCGHAGQPERALRLYEEMRAEGVLPDEACLTSLILSCGTQLPHDALRFFDCLVCGLHKCPKIVQ